MIPCEFSDLGRSSKALANLFTHLKCKLARFESHSGFLRDCQDNDLMPRGLRLGLKPNSPREENWKKTSELARLRLRRNETREEACRTRQRLIGVASSLRRRGASEEAMVSLEAFGDAIHARTAASLNIRKEKKFSRLLLENGGLTFWSRRPKSPRDSTNVVINLTPRPLTEDEMAVLSLGTRFAPPPSKFPALDMAVRCQRAAEIATQSAARHGVSGDDVATFLNKAEAVLTRAGHRPLPSLPKSLSSSLKALQKENERVVIPADKARAVVVMEQQDYTDILLRNLQPPIYEELRDDPSRAYSAGFNNKLLTAFAGPARPGGRRYEDLRTQDPDAFRLYKRLSKSHGRCGAFYGLVKTHKYDAPPRSEDERLQWLSNLKLRPICPGYRSVDYQLCKHLTTCLQSLPRPSHSVSSPMEVLELLSLWEHVASRCRLVSLDVAAMFPSIPTSRAVPLVRKMLNENAESLADVTHLKPDAIADLLQLSIDNCHAVVRDGQGERFFRQRQGLAMGKSYSPVVADLFMGEWEKDLEDLALASGVRLFAFCRYADDLLCLLEGDDATLDTWVAKVNAKDESIKVTSEQEIEGVLPYLDILIYRTQVGFSTSVYRKGCTTNQVTAFSSFTEPRYLKAAVRSDAIRAFRYCGSWRVREKELDFIRNKFSRYGYPILIINNIISQVGKALALKRRALPAPPDPAAAEANPIRLSVPFTGPSFFELKRAAQSIGVQLVSKPKLTLASCLTSHAKHKLDRVQESDVVYLIECSCTVDGDPVIYIGETDRELQTRVKEHQDSWSGRVKSKANSSAFSAHRECTPAFDSVEILAREPNNQLRLLLESAYIRTVGRRETILVSPNDANVNRNSGTRLEDRWLPIIRDSCHRPARP